VTAEVQETDQRLGQAAAYVTEHLRPLVELRSRVNLAAAQQAALGAASVTLWLQARRDEVVARRELIAAELAWSELSWNRDVDALIAHLGP
jgi:hypothetical protein